MKIRVFLNFFLFLSQKNSIMNKKNIICAMFFLVTTAGWAQTEETAYTRNKEDWSAGGILLLAFVGSTEGFDNSIEQYMPHVPEIWFGPSFVNMGKNQSQIHLKSGLLNKFDCGCTILLVSRNLYRGMVGVSAGIQTVAPCYTVANDYGAYKGYDWIEVAPKDNYHDKEYFSFTMLRIPVLVGAQTRNHHFSVQTGFGLCYSSKPGAQWLATVGIGPVTVNYSKNLSPLFKTRDGARAYPSSITVGVDLLYIMCHGSK